MAGAWDVVADALGFGPSGNDHASSNWAAWGHEEICSRLNTSVDPGDIGDAARALRQQGRNTTDAITGLTRDLQGIVFDGWRGAATDAALTALGPINQWSAEQADTAGPDHPADGRLGLLHGAGQVCCAATEATRLE